MLAGPSRAARSTPTFQVPSAATEVTTPGRRACSTTATLSRESARRYHPLSPRSTSHCRHASTLAVRRMPVGPSTSATRALDSAHRPPQMKLGRHRTSVIHSAWTRRRAMVEFARTRVWMDSMRRRVLLTGALSLGQDRIAVLCPRSDAVRVWPRLVTVDGAQATTPALPSEKMWSSTSAGQVSRQNRALAKTLSWVDRAAVTILTSSMASHEARVLSQDGWNNNF